MSRSRHTGRTASRQQTCAQIVSGVAEGVGQGGRHVDRAHAAADVFEPAPHLRQGTAGSGGIDGVAAGGEPLPVIGPAVEDAVQAQDGMEARIGFDAAFPQRPFLRIQGVVGHDDRADAGQLQDPINMLVERLGVEEGARLVQVGGAGGEPKGLQHAHHSARRLGDRRAAHKQFLPDQVGLRDPVQVPVLLGRNRGDAEQFRLQVMVGDQRVDAPPSDFAEGRRIEVGVHVECGSRGQRIADDGGDVAGRERNREDGNSVVHGQSLFLPEKPGECSIPSDSLPARGLPTRGAADVPVPESAADLFTGEQGSGSMKNY